ncbi:MAG: hypothetical protein AAEJ52_03515 [Myxococcota bacterium]
MHRPSSGYIAGPWVDTFFLIGAPLVGIAMFVPFGVNPPAFYPIPDFHFAGFVADGFITAVIFSHLGLVFFRSHLNTAIFRKHRFRFVGAPILLFAGVYTSTWALLLVGVLATWWDVYHSSMQTFGIGRLYDLRAGNDPEVGRRLDRIWSLLLYAGPILGGASLIIHLDDFYTFQRVGSALFVGAPAAALGYARYLTYAVLGFGTLFTAYYIHSYRNLSKQGYRISPQKVALYAILGVVSIVCWGFNSYAEAFFVMNFFHALQYFFIVWYTEKGNITKKIGLGRFALGRYVALMVFVMTATCFGVWSTGYWLGPDSSLHLFEATLLVVSIMHFWYDGFIWSIRRKELS